MTLESNFEITKLEIINWINKIHDERIISKINALRIEEIDNPELTEKQKEEIIKAINTLEEQ